jgi:hypothetical protein
MLNTEHYFAKKYFVQNLTLLEEVVKNFVKKGPEDLEIFFHIRTNKLKILSKRPKSPEFGQK